MRSIALRKSVEGSVVSSSEDENAPAQREKSADHGLLATDFLACLPHNYVTEARHRIEAYRKLAQATDKPALESLQREWRDRFGPLPPPVESLLQIAEVKILASERGVTAIEVKEDRLMLTRSGDYLMIGAKFPRLTKQTAAGRLKEIKKLLLAL